MKRLIFALALFAAPAFAQPAPPTTEAGVYQQLLSEANDRLAKAVVQNQTMGAELQKLQARIKVLEAAKIEPPKK